MTGSERSEKEQVEWATSGAPAAPFDDPQLAELMDGWRVLDEALAPLRGSALAEDLLIEQVRRRAWRAAGWRGVRWLLAASLLVAVIGKWPQARTPVAVVAPPAETVVTKVEETPTETELPALEPWDDELADELAAVEAEFRRIERRWQSPPDSFANIRWRMEELEAQVTQSSL